MAVAVATGIAVEGVATAAVGVAVATPSGAPSSEPVQAASSSAAARPRRAALRAMPGICRIGCGVSFMQHLHGPRDLAETAG